MSLFLLLGYVLERLKKQAREYNNATIILIIIMITNLL